MKIASTPVKDHQLIARKLHAPGVSIYAIYHPAADFANQERRRVDDGVVELSHLCYETGGAAYFVKHSAMETIVPFLDDVPEHLDRQYLLTVVFDAAPESHPVAANLELMAPAKVWVGSTER